MLALISIRQAVPLLNTLVNAFPCVPLKNAFKTFLWPYVHSQMHLTPFFSHFPSQNTFCSGNRHLIKDRKCCKARLHSLTALIYTFFLLKPMSIFTFKVCKVTRRILKLSSVSRRSPNLSVRKGRKNIWDS